jgi:hypothetical protein
VGLGLVQRQRVIRNLWDRNVLQAFFISKMLVILNLIQDPEQNSEEGFLDSGSLRHSSGQKSPE